MLFHKMNSIVMILEESNYFDSIAWNKSSCISVCDDKECKGVFKLFEHC